MRLGFPLQERSLSSWAVALHTALGSTSTRRSCAPAYLPCQIAPLDGLGGALSLLTCGVNYGQIKCFLPDSRQRSSAPGARRWLGEGISAARLASFAAAARDTTSASPRSAAELLPVYSSAVESLARGTMKTSPYVNPHKLFMLLDNSAPAVWFTILCSFSSFTY